jgi:DNA-directed RNA polymerase subunit M/transcription elongation factor TFIIS
MSDRSPQFILSEIRVVQPGNSGDLLLTDSQIESLIKLTYKGQDARPIFTTSDHDILFQVITMLLHPELGFDKTYDFLKKAKDRQYVLFESPLLFEAKQKTEIENEILRNKPLKLTGGAVCKYCNSKRTQLTTQQLRAADEPMTSTVYCLDCGRRTFL